MHPLLAEFMASLFDVVSVTDQVFERLFKMLAKVDDAVFRVDVEALQVERLEEKAAHK